jgi:hypothetical protein
MTHSRPAPRAATWVSTDLDTYSYTLAAPVGFKRLLDYIQGGNAEGGKIPMTAPVVVGITPAATPFAKRNFTVSFYVPPEFEKHPPQPNNTDVTLTCTPAFTAFVAQKSGYVLDDYSIGLMAKGVMTALDAAGIKYVGDRYYFASYDPPFRFKGRHNEVWVLASGEEGAEMGKARAQA